jgi:hypothetical protein
MAGETKLNILTGYNDKGVKEAMANLKGMGDGLKDFSKKLLGGYVGFQGLQRGITFIRGTLDASRDLQRNLAGLSTIFGSSTKEMTAFAEAGAAMGMSTAEAAKASTFMGSVLKQSGFAMDDNIMFTKKLVSLGADLAATYGYDVQEALTGMTALFRGEYDPIEKFGVAIKQAQVNTEMHRLGLWKLTGQERLHAQQLIRMKMLLEATADAQGAVGRQGNTLAVSQAQLAAGWANMQAQLGNTLIGPMTVLIQIMQSLTSVIGEPLQKLFEAISGLFIGAAGNANQFAYQVTNIIGQITLLVNIAVPILQVLTTVLSYTLAPLVGIVVTFKVLRGIIIGVGAVTKAYSAIQIILAARAGLAAGATAAQAAATTAAGLAAEGAIAPTVALGIATMLTPWGLVALAIAGVAGAIALSGIIAANTTPAVGELGRVASVSGSNMADLNGNMLTGSTNASLLTGNMSDLASATSLAAAEAKKITGFVPDYQKARAALRGDDVKAAKNKPKPELDAIGKALEAMKKLTGGGLADATGKAAKALADPFVKMSKSIQDEMAKLHDSLMSTFDITAMGSNGSSMAINIEKFMVKMRKFSDVMRQLKSMGLNGSLMSQLAMAGPEKGLAAASALAGDQNLINQANAAYGEMNTLSTGIASNVVQSKAAPVYNISVNAGVGDKRTIGMAVVEAIKTYERTNGAVWKSA